MIETTDTLGLRLTALLESGAHRFDPVRFSYIQSLTKRSIGKRESVCRFLEQKALKALDDYQVRFDKARAAAADIVARVSLKYPDSAGMIRGLFEHCDFKGVQRLNGRLNRGRSRNPLVTLTNLMTRGWASLDENETQLSFDDLLRKQEDDIIGSLGDLPSCEGGIVGGHKMELRSIHLFKQTLARLNSDKLVTNAIKERPENPGPLNPHMLATRSLSAMRNLSPSYLKRFVAHIDALLWLEQAGKIVTPRAAKYKKR